MMYMIKILHLVSEMTYDDKLPVPFGVFYKEDKLTYEDMMMDQIKESIKLKAILIYNH